MNNSTKTTTQTGKRQSKFTDNCKFCGEWVNLDDEGNTYRDGSCAHEACFERENAADFRD